jgi:small subunit ribosomal protein S6
MQKYELLYIIPAKYSDDEIDGVKEGVNKILDKVGAKTIKEENLGKIKLAYPINKMRHGTYILVYLEVESSELQELNRQLNLSEDVLRHMLLTLAEGAENKSYTIEEYEPPIVDKVRERKVRREPAKKALPPPPPAKPEESNLSIEELDKKLDEILSEDLTKNI